MAAASDEKSSKCDVEALYAGVVKRDPHQTKFLQAVKEVLDSLAPLFEKYPKYAKVVPVICEPERVIQFRVPWVDDKGNHQVNRGFRVQFSQTLGPYKGGLRLHPSVDLSTIKFLGFEQVFKNALTGLPMGGGKGGSDFDPKGKSDNEVLRFCQSFMTELSRHIGPDTDVPAGDIGVGGREIGYLFGHWKRMTVTHSGVLTGKGPKWGGSKIRPEATGYGLVYITEIAMQTMGESVKGKRCAISGSGNVAQFAAEKVLHLGGTVVSLSDSTGTIIEENGFSREQLDEVVRIKTARGRCAEYMEFSKTAKYHVGKKPWALSKYDIALPSACENEINEEDAKALVAGGCQYVAEGANMPSTPEAIEVFKTNCKFFIPAKASNAGGVAVSGLEMSQNSGRTSWTRGEVDKKLHGIMQGIYTAASEMAADLGSPGDFQLGANAAGFKTVADAMFDQGAVMP